MITVKHEICQAWNKANIQVKKRVAKKFRFPVWKQVQVPVWTQVGMEVSNVITEQEKEQTNRE